MQTLFNQDNRTALLTRLSHLTSESQPLWGRMTAGEVVCHLADPFRVALREKKVRDLSGPLRIPGVAHAVVWVVPWPKGAPTSPAYLPGKGMTNPTEFDRDKRDLVTLVDRFATLPPNAQIPRNPVFGEIGRGGWGRLMWRHLDHHLRQFGL
jgi:hypothetical protein